MQLMGTVPHHGTHENGGCDVVNNDVLVGIVPVIPSAWATDPTNLANITDGSEATSTGIGSVTALADNKVLEFDLGRSIFISRVVSYCSVVQDEYAIYIGNDAPTYTGGTPDNMTCISAMAADVRKSVLMSAVHFKEYRYLVLVFHSPGTVGSYVVNRFMAFEA